MERITARAAKPMEQSPEEWDERRTKGQENKGSLCPEGICTVEDWRLEPDRVGELGIGMQGVVVTRQAVDLSLERRHDLLLHMVWVAIRNFDGLRVGDTRICETFGADLERSAYHFRVHLLIC